TTPTGPRPPDADHAESRRPHRWEAEEVHDRRSGHVTSRRERAAEGDASRPHRLPALGAVPALLAVARTGRRARDPRPPRCVVTRRRRAPAARHDTKPPVTAARPAPPSAADCC